MILCMLLLFQTAGVNEQTFYKIKAGMTKQEVIGLLQRPPKANLTAADRLCLFTTIHSHYVRQQGEIWQFGEVARIRLAGSSRRRND